MNLNQPIYKLKQKGLKTFREFCEKAVVVEKSEATRKGAEMWGRTFSLVSRLIITHYVAVTLSSFPLQLGRMKSEKCVCVRNGISDVFLKASKVSIPLLSLKSAPHDFKWNTTQQHLMNFMFFALAKILLTDDMMNKHADRDKCSSTTSLRVCLGIKRTDTKYTKEK